VVGRATADLDIALIKTDREGNVQWRKVFGGGGNERTGAVLETPDGGYIVSGYTSCCWSPEGIQGVFLLKTDEAGEQEWLRIFPNGSSGFESPKHAYPVLVRGESRYLTGGSLTDGEREYLWIVQTTPEGSTDWELKHGGDAVHREVNSLRSTSDGGFVCAGVFGKDAPARAYLVKFSAERVPFLRSDSTDDGRVNLSDAVFSLSYLFRGGDPPVCTDAADANDDGELDVSDPVYTLNYLFGGGPQPAGPFGECGTDPTADALACGALEQCR